MDARALSPAQRTELLYALAARRDWLLKLRERMDAQGWHRDDPFYAAVRGAWDALHAALHALAESEPKEPEEPPPERPWVNRSPDPPAPPPEVGLPDVPWVGKRGKSRRR